MGAIWRALFNPGRESRPTRRRSLPPYARSVGKNKSTDARCVTLVNSLGRLTVGPEIIVGCEHTPLAVAGVKTAANRASRGECCLMPTTRRLTVPVMN